MDEELSSILIIYFNNILKNSLKYRETYNPPIYSRGGNILFTRDKFDDLKNILVSNVNITRQLKDELFDVLKDYYLDLTSINLEFSPEGFEIILERNPLNTLNVDPYVNIASNFDTVEQLDDFCRFNRGMMRICRTKEFWRNLLKVVYPEVYKGDYKYEAVYKGYLSVLNKDIIRLSDILSDMNVFEYIKFMINEDLITTQNYRKFIIPAIYLNSLSSLGKIIEYAGNIKNISDIIRPEFYEAIRIGSVRYMSNLLNIISNDNRILNVKHLIWDLLDQDKFLWDINVIDVLREYAKNIVDPNENWANLLVRDVIENVILFKSEDSLRHILTTYKVPFIDASMWLEDTPDAGDNIRKVLEDYLKSYHQR